MSQGDTQGSETGKNGVFTDTVDSILWREFYAPTLANTKEGGLHVRSVCMDVAYQLTLLGSHIIMVQWRTWKV